MASVIMFQWAIRVSPNAILLAFGFSVAISIFIPLLSGAQSRKPRSD